MSRIGNFRGKKSVSSCKKTTGQGNEEWLLTGLFKRGDKNSKIKLWWWCSVTKLYPTLWDPTDYSTPGSSIHGILQARILEWVAISSSCGFSRPTDWTHVSWIFCLGRWILYHWATVPLNANFMAAETVNLVHVFWVTFPVWSVVPATQKIRLMLTGFAERADEYLMPKSHLGSVYTWEKVSAKQTYPF